MPTEAAAIHRAPLAQTLRPAWARTPAKPADAAGAAGSAAPAVIAPPTPTDLVPESALQE